MNNFWEGPFRDQVLRFGRFRVLLFRKVLKLFGLRLKD